jgi:hypothetical protein
MLIILWNSQNIEELNSRVRRLEELLSNAEQGIPRSNAVKIPC